MNIQTKFNNGDKVFTIDHETMKVKEFEIGTICVCAIGCGAPSVSYYEKVGSESYGEARCFASESELLAYITTKDNTK